MTPVARLALLVLTIATASASASEKAAPGEAPAAAQSEPSDAPSRARDAGDLRPSANARRSTLKRLRAQLAHRPARSDGGGRAWLDVDGGSTVRPTAGSIGRWVILHQSGDLGIRVGGSVVLEVPPFLGWSVPQLSEPLDPGYVMVSTDAPGVSLDPSIKGMRIRVRVRDRGLRAGEQMRIVYGAGPSGAQCDTSAERDSRFWVYVDGDGDGKSLFLAESPAIDVVPGDPHRLHLAWPSTARPGDAVGLSVAVLDAHENAGIPFVGEISITGAPSALEGARVVRFDASDLGSKTIEYVVHQEGVYSLSAKGPGGLEGRSGPLVVSARRPRVLWGDLHGHSNFSDGTGTPDDFFRYARDVAALDVAALTDHDHWGAPRFLDRTPEAWEEIRAVVERFHEPGRFVSLLGYEWTNWLHGHRHVLYFQDGGPVLSSVDPRFETPLQLWDALRGQEALTFAHHSAGNPVATNWTVPPDPAFEPVTEIVSTAGSSEMSNTPFPIEGSFPGAFVRDALRLRYRLGFVGSSDSHDGHPGCTRGPPDASCGLAGILSEELSRESVLAALRARRVYATNGPRILLSTTLDGQPMGSVLAASQERLLHVDVFAPRPLDRIEIIRGGRTVESIPCDGKREISLEQRLSDLRPAETLYVRVVQVDQGAAWSSPFFFE